MKTETQKREKREMGKVTTTIKVENLADVFRAEAGEVPADQVRSVELEALVDTGATLLCLPLSVINALGLRLLEKKEAITASGPVPRGIYRGAQLTIGDRNCIINVMELPEKAPPLVGYIALENLDFIVDPINQTLIANPAHGGKQVFDLL
jgi:clan AA aspartic protease